MPPLQAPSPDPAEPSGSPRAPFLMVRVTDAIDAAAAAAAGFDIVETTSAAAAAVRAAFPGRLRLRLLQIRDDDVIAATAMGVDELCCPAAATPALRTSLPLVASIPVGAAANVDVARLCGVADGIVLDVARGERLFGQIGIADLDACAKACRALGLSLGFAGDLETPDVARLRLLRPDHLGFDTAVRHGHHGDASLDPAALEALRGLIPHQSVPHDAGHHVAGIERAIDQVFVRDFVTTLSIGAYRAERDACQRVRFCVEADVLRPAADVRDMRDVFSYDVIIETIRMLAQRQHVSFVETLAAEIADILLADPRLVAVSVSVEKLDVIDGAVGVRIRRP